MNHVMLTALEIIREMIVAIGQAIGHNWIVFSIAILFVSVLRTYINVETLKGKLLNKPKVSIAGSVAFGALTPLCAAGTLGLAVGLLTTVLPWGPIMAFLTSSPLMSPNDFIMISGIIDLRFATALAIASVVIGLGSGYLTHIIQKRTKFLDNQTRFDEAKWSTNIGCGQSAPNNSCTPIVKPCDAQSTCSGKKTHGPITFKRNVNSRIFKIICNIRWIEIGRNIYNIGIKNMLLYFSIFVAIGFLITRFIPTSIISGLLGAQNISAVPIAAAIGLPLYITPEASIPLVKSFMAQGASSGAMLAFWIGGQATNVTIIAGLATFMKHRILGLYIAFVLIGAILAGYAYNFFISFHF